MNKYELDLKLSDLLSILSKLQKSDGSFDTLFAYNINNNDIAWKHWNDNSNPPGDTAFILFPLLNIGGEKSKSILNKGLHFVVKKSNGMKLWKYPDNEQLNIVMPYDLDSTVYCSFFLEKMKIVVKNKKIIDRLINNNKNYNEFFNPYKFFFSQRLSISICTIKAFNRTTIFSNRYALIDDWEFGITCNTLLYMGLTDKNIEVWVGLKNDFINDNLRTIYYNKFFAIYSYSRLFFNYKHLSCFPSSGQTQIMIDKYYQKLNFNDNSVNFLFLAIAILHFDLDNFTNKYDKLFSHIFTELENAFLNPRVYYSGHSKIGSDEENAYFGSKATTCSLFLEFLNLYRKRVYGSFFSM